MKPFTFTLLERPRQTIDLSPLTPNNLEGKSFEQISALRLASGNRTYPVAELFQLSEGDTQQIVIQNSCELLNFIGRGMTRGSITVDGDAGAYAALHMHGGLLTVTQNVGAYAASGMNAGLVQVRGDAGDFLAASVAGDAHGMRGGTVVVGGSCGERLGDRMRRGTVLVRGATGGYCASRMLAGTIVVEGKVGYLPGLRMQRGTLIAASASAVPATFNDCGENTFPFLTLLARHLQALGHPLRAPTLKARRYLGDLANDGRGEILIPA